MQLFDDGKLIDHLISINESAEEQVDYLTKCMMEVHGVNEQLERGSCNYCV